MPSGFAIVLPARFHSTRFPGKPLALIAGRPLIEWVYRRAVEVPGAARVIVATDDERIFSFMRGIGGEAAMTSPRCITGTDRVAEVARAIDCDPIVNLQGDEPLFPPELVTRMVEALRGDSRVDIVTACHPISQQEEALDPNSVKVVVDEKGNALYFSRSPIPYRRMSASAANQEAGSEDRAPLGRRHMGVYTFRKESLLRFASLPRSPLEVSEELEQLRALENGMRIHVLETSQRSVGVDVPADLKMVEKALTPGLDSIP